MEKMCGIILIAILCILSAFAVLFRIHQNIELSQFPGDQVTQEVFTHLGEIDCLYKCTKVADSTGCNYYSSNKTCILLKNSIALKSANKYQVTGYMRGVNTSCFENVFKLISVVMPKNIMITSLYINYFPFFLFP